MAVAAPAATRGARLPVGWPVYLLFGLFPLWWVLGLASVIWFVMAVPMLVWLVWLRGVRAPRGFGLWVVFLVWMLASATQLDTATRWIAFVYRAGLYLSVTIVFLYVYNLPRDQAPARRILVAVALFWMAMVVGGFLGVLDPNGSFSTPVEQLVPSNYARNAFVHSLIHPSFAQVQGFLGYPVGRPSAPFTYTNEWGANLSLATPLAIAAVGVARRRWFRNLIRVLLVASLVPIVVSLNRGMWLGLGLGLLYVAVRAAVRGNARLLAGVVALLVLVGGLVVLSPLKQLVADRLAHPHSNSRRVDLTQQALQGWSRSPVFGFGGPRPSAQNPNEPPVGTHGAVQLVLFSHGLPGLLFFVGWWLWAFLATFRAPAGVPLWGHVVIFIALVELPYYSMLYAQLHLVAVGAALSFRELHAEQARRAAAKAAKADAVEGPEPVAV